MAKRARTNPAVGEVWWCDGAALAFEARFKNRPVLVVSTDPPASLYVMPLSSHRRFGQEIAVTHSAGVSYMTGAIVTVPATALYRPLGAWAGFEAWQADQRKIADEIQKSQRRWQWWKDLLKRLFHRTP